MMGRIGGRILPLAVLATLAACTSPPPAPPEFGPADEAAIRASLSAYMVADPDVDPDAFFSEFSEDVHWVFNGLDPWEGMEALRANDWCNTLGAEIAADRVSGVQELAYARGAYSIELNCSDDIVTSAGSFLSVHRKGDDGRWRIEALHQFDRD